MNMAFLAPIRSPRAILVALALAAAAALPVAAQAGTAASDWVRSAAADVRLVSAIAGTEGRDSVPLGLEFRLSEGWKVYWRSAGEVGYPPQVEWDGSRNLAETVTRYPVPQRFSAFGIEQYGYHDHVVYPITARLAEPGKPLALSAAVNALVCSDICVPLDATLTLDLPASAPDPTAFTQLLDRWSSRVPGNLPGVGLTVTDARATGDPASPTLLLHVTSSEALDRPDVYPEGPAGLSFGKPEASVAADRRSADLRIPIGIRDGARLSAAALTLTVVDGDRFVEQTVTVDAAPVGRSAAGPALDAAAWIAMLGTALLGGLILNLMPCVLPVLSLKLVSAVRYGGAARTAVRRGFLASAAGIVASFLALAGGAVALKAAGVSVGWGMQFQQPVFLAAMAAVVVLFAANLWGLFEVPLPRSIADFGARLPAGSASPETTGGSLTGHFLTGAFATLLATPCSAPFLGTAIGFALGRGPGEIVAVFAVMGLGLALPYLAVAAVPELARLLPRPGAWMLGLKRVLALVLAATALWLLSVLAAQIGAVPAAAVALAFIAGIAALALVRSHRLSLAAGTVAIAAALLVAGTADRPPRSDGGSLATTGPGTAVTWQPFDRAAIDRLVGDGRVVLVDVTADWCLTCKVNKAAVLDRDPVAGLLGGGSVVAMRADWTNPNPAITDYLASFGRYGIPFNAVYGPAAPRGIALSELLTDAEVLAAIRQAGSAAATAQLD